MPTPDRNRFFDEDHRVYLQERLRANGHRLDARQVDILLARAGLVENRYFSYRELAGRYQVTSNRIWQIERTALAKLEQRPDLGPHLRLIDDEPAALRESDLLPERPGVIGEVIQLTPSGPLTLAQARFALLAHETRVGDRLGALLNSWLKTTESPHTRAAYLRDISQYFDYCIERDEDPLTIRIQDFNLYRDYLATYAKPDGRPYAPSTRKRKVAAIASFYHFLVEVDAIDRNPVKKRTKYTPVKRNKTLSKENTVALFDDAATGHQTLGDLCAQLVVHLLFTMGMRVSEVCNLEIDQLTYAEQDGKRYRGISFIGKGGKPNDRGIPPELDAALLTPYLAERPQPASPEAGLALLLTLDGKRINRNQVYKLVRRAHRRGVVSDKVSPHWGRHTFNTRAEEDGRSLEQRQHALDHASPVTTQGYSQMRNNIVDDPSHAVAATLYAYRAQHNSTPHDRNEHSPEGETSHEQSLRSA